MRTRSVILGSTLLAMLGCGDEVTSPGGPAALAAGRGTAAAVADSAILVFAGDIHANCGRYNQANATAALVQRFPAALVIPLGDNAGIHGTAAEYECYGQTWGAFKGRTYATIGNHELNQDTAGTAHYDYSTG